VGRSGERHTHCGRTPRHHYGVLCVKIEFKRKGIV
jgi:hypothetical protein